MSSIIPVICHNYLNSSTGNKKVYASTSTEKVETEEPISISYTLVKPIILLVKSLREKKKHGKRK